MPNSRMRLRHSESGSPSLLTYRTWRDAHFAFRADVATEKVAPLAYLAQLRRERVGSKDGAVLKVFLLETGFLARLSKRLICDSFEELEEFSMMLKVDIVTLSHNRDAVRILNCSGT